MSATIMSEPTMVVSSQDSSAPKTTSNVTANDNSSMEIQSAKCECCCFIEECTPEYIQRIRERYMGKWVCGLCAEAVRDEVIKSERLITTDEALNRHMNICRKFRSSSPLTDNPTAVLITAVRQIMRRSLDSPRGARSSPASPTSTAARKCQLPVLARSESCFPTLSG